MYTWDKVIGSSEFATHDKTVKKAETLNEAETWWKDNYHTLYKGIYQLTKWSGSRGIIIKEIRIS